MSDVVKAGNTVSIDYVGKLDDGTVFDSTDGRGAFEFEAGSERVIPGMSSAVVGMQVGEQKSVEIPPEQAYGEHNPELVVKVSSDRLPDGAKQGDVLSDGTPNGPNWVLVEQSEEESTLDGNHPLAGKTLFFDVTVKGIQ